MRQPPLHPACKLFPPLGESDLQDLADDIAENGLLNPIVMLNGKILDGRNRWKACKLAGVEPRFVEFDGSDPIAWVVSQNLVRRHLTASQRAVVALDLLPILERQAKQRQRLSNGRGKKVRKDLDTFSSNGRSSKIAAKIAGTNSAYVQTVKSIGKQAPDLIDEIRNGNINIPDAERLAELPKRERTNLLKAANGNGDIWRHHKRERTPKPLKPVKRTAAQRKARINKTTLMCGDCRTEMAKLRAKSVDAIISDPIYPEVDRAYGRISEADWHDLMHEVAIQSRRILKPTGSAVFVFQPNYEAVGKMRLWLWEFVVWAGREWNLIQDVYWWATDAMPLTGTNRKQGLTRQSVKMCVWLGPPDCYRNQEAVLWTPSQSLLAKNRSDMALSKSPNGRSFRNGTGIQAVEERGGTTPFNVLPIPTGGNPGGADHHPATTPYDVAAWWCRYLLPPTGVLLDPFCGSGTMLQAGLDCGARKVIGIDQKKEYLATAKRRVRDG